MDHRTLAIVSIAGSSLDVLGALYLAYDLLGGEHGPLRLLTRAVTYGLLFTVGIGVPLGPIFGIAVGVTHGITLAWELSWASRGCPDPGFWYDAAASAIRGIGYGVGAAWSFGPLFGLIFGAMCTVSQVVAYRIGIRPTMDYAVAPRPRITRRHVWSALNRTVGYGVLAGLLCSWVAHEPQRALWFGLRVGLTIGLVTAILSGSMPMVEWAADKIPERRMGVLGVALILTGFALQSVQYWVTLLDIPLQ